MKPEYLLLKYIRWKMNNKIDQVFHPQRKWLEDFLAHYIVEKCTGLSDRVILLKALRYYFKGKLFSRFF